MTGLPVSRTKYETKRASVLLAHFILSAERKQNSTDMQYHKYLVVIVNLLYTTILPYLDPLWSGRMRLGHVQYTPPPRHMKLYTALLKYEFHMSNVCRPQMNCAGDVTLAGIIMVWVVQCEPVNGLLHKDCKNVTSKKARMFI